MAKNIFRKLGFRCYFIVSIFSLIFSFPFVALAAPITYGTGYYTNLYGSGEAANLHTGAYCNPSTGSCWAPGGAGTSVVKFTCNGKTAHCNELNGTETWSTSNRVDNPHPGTGKTVQLDVFNKKCRVGDYGWETDCQELDYMVWYSGDSAPAAPTVDLKANGSDGPITINYNTSATLSWISTNSTSCTALIGWSGARPTSGSESTGNLTTSRVYTISCTGAGGSAADTVTVNVNQPTPAPTVDIKANGSDWPSPISYNTSATLSWTSSNATACNASGDWFGSKATSGSESTGNLTSTKTYTISCTGPGGSANDSVTVNVNQPTPAPTVDIKANGSDGPVTIDYNSAASLSWTSTNSTSCNASGDWSGTKAIAGFENTSLLTASRFYTITCMGPGGTANDSVSVIVGTQPTLGVTLEAIPNSGTAPLSGVDLRATVSGTATGSMNYRFDCTNDGSWDYTFNSIWDNPKTVIDACNYPSAGTYTAKVYVERNTATPAQATTTVTVSAQAMPTVDIKANGSDGPITIAYNTAATLSWTSSNATSCNALGDWTGGKAVVGSELTGNLTSTKTYTISCTGPGGTVSDNVTVNVNTPSAPTVDLKANGSDGPITIAYNTAATLSWTSTNSTSCNASGDWSGAKGLSGSESTGNLVSTKTYTISCTGTGGTASDSVTVNVTVPSAPTVDLKANGSDGPVTIDYNTAATLSWTSANATACTAYGDWSGTKGISGSESTGNLTSTKTYTISCTGTGGTASDSVTVIVGSAPLPALNIVKLGKNLTQGQAIYADSIFAYPSDRIEFKITVTSTGSSIANNVAVRDILADRMTYVGNLRIDGVFSGGNIISGINLGSMSPSQAKNITFEADIFSDVSFGYGTTNLVDTAQAWADLISQQTDTAIVNVTRTAPPPTSPGLSVAKIARNITDGAAFGELISADPSDRVEFQITVTSIGSTTANNVVVIDTLPSNLAYSGNIRVDGVPMVGGNITSGFNLGSMPSGTSKTVLFEVTVASDASFGYGTTSLVNTVSVRADTLTAVYDSATVNIAKGTPSGTLTLVKTVKNLSLGHIKWYESLSAVPSDRIAYRIEVRTNSTFAQNVIVTDTLPPKMIYAGNLKVDDMPSSGNLASGISIGNLSAGQVKTITFEASVASPDNFVYGNTNLINTAVVYNAIQAATGTAKVLVVKRAVAGEITEVPTGVLNSLLVSLGVTVLLTYCLLLGFFFYQRVFIKSGAKLGNEISKAKSRVEDLKYSVNPFDSQEKAERRLQRIISEIKEKEN